MSDRCRDCNDTGGFEGIPATQCPSCGKWLPECVDHKWNARPHNEALDYNPVPPDEDRDLEPVYATLHFYYNDPDSMRRMKECLDAPKWKSAVWEFDRWMRNRIKYNPDSEDDPLYISDDGITWLQAAREQLCMRLEDHGIDIWDE